MNTIFFVSFLLAFKDWGKGVILDDGFFLQAHRLRYAAGYYRTAGLRVIEMNGA